MNEADQILAGFHPIANKLLFERLHAFEAATVHLDRKHDEQRYQALCMQFANALRHDLEAEAHGFLKRHQHLPQLGAIDMHLRRMIVDYGHQFVQRCS